MKEINAEFEKLIDEVKKYNPKSNTEGIRKAWNFASTAHAGQKRLSGEEYISHPLEVARIIVHWKLDTTTIIAALLHDTAEDTDTTIDQIEKEFGVEAALLVKGVTKVTNVRLRGSRNEIFVEGLRKMILVMATDLRVVFIKLADRIHNMKTVSALPKRKRKQNARESIGVYAPLAERLGVREAKAILEKLSFPILYPKSYRKIRLESQKYFIGAEKSLNSIIGKTIEGLIKHGVENSTVYGRNKNLYSLWRKLQRPEIGNNYEKIYDIIAIRILVEDIVSCYKSLGVVHGLFKPAPHFGVSDFIAQPKPNGYQSIHTRVFGTSGVIEIQIRTKEMHDQAEYGLAAHWAYSEAKSKKGVTDKFIKSGQVFTKDAKLDWVRQLVEWQKEIVDSKEFIDRVKFDALSHRIFAYSPKGDVYDLPTGATPVDYAFAVHSDLGYFIKGAKINGKIVSLNHKIQNGDIVEILKSKVKRPINKDWLQFAVTSIAKKEIAKELRKV